MTKSLATLFIATIFSTSFAQMGGMGFGYSGGGGTVDSVRAAGSAKNLQGGVAGAIPVQTASGTTGFSSVGTAGQALVSGGTGVPTWFNPPSGRVIFSDAGGVLSNSSNLTWDQSAGIFKVLGQSGGGFKLGELSSQYGAIYGANVTNPDATNYSWFCKVDGAVSVFNATQSGPGWGISFRILNSNRMTVGTAAHVYIAAGTSSPNTAPLKFTAGTNLTTPEAGAMEFDGTNLYFTPSATRQTVTLSSDSSLKRDVVDYSDALKKVLAMRPVHFRYKVGSDTTLHVGLIAQELVHVDSSLVDYGVDGEARGVKYLEVIPVLVRAIQEQDARITALEKRNMFFGIFTGVVLVGLVVVVVRKKAD